MTSKKEREIFHLLVQKINNIESVTNAFDIGGLKRYYDNSHKVLLNVREILLSLSCYDIPQEEVDYILKNLEDELK